MCCFTAPGLGKTTLSGIIANEMGTKMKVTSGPAIEKPGEMAAILNNLQEGDVLFVDEIHRLKPSGGGGTLSSHGGLCHRYYAGKRILRPAPSVWSCPILLWWALLPEPAFLRLL